MYVLVDGFRIRFIFFLVQETQKITKQKTKHIIFDNKKITNKNFDLAAQFLIYFQILTDERIQLTNPQISWLDLSV